MPVQPERRSSPARCRLGRTLSGPRKDPTLKRRESPKCVRPRPRNPKSKSNASAAAEKRAIGGATGGRDPRRDVCSSFWLEEARRLRPAQGSKGSFFPSPGSSCGRRHSPAGSSHPPVPSAGEIHVQQQEVARVYCGRRDYFPKDGESSESDTHSKTEGEEVFGEVSCSCLLPCSTTASSGFLGPDDDFTEGPLCSYHH